MNEKADNAAVCSFSLVGPNLSMPKPSHKVCVRFDTAEVRRLNRCRISVGYNEKD